MKLWVALAGVVICGALAAPVASANDSTTATNKVAEVIPQAGQPATTLSSGLLVTQSAPLDRFHAIVHCTIEVAKFVVGNVTKLVISLVTAKTWQDAWTAAVAFINTSNLSAVIDACRIPPAT